MKKIILFVLVLAVSLMMLTAASEKITGIAGFNGGNLNTKEVVRPMGTVKPDLNFGRFPLYFITNNGQVNEKAKFYAKASRYTLWLTKEGLVFDSTHSFPSSKPIRDVSRLVFLNANRAPGIIPVEETKHRVNYFKGNDKSKWHGDIPTSKAVLYKSLYKNIDLKVYGIEKEIEYDWMVKPGGNPEAIRFQYKNVKGTKIDDRGNLLIETQFGRLVHKRPVSFQKSTRRGIRGRDGKDIVNATFKKLGKDTYGFEVGEYDRSRELVIDPVVLAYSTYLGGSSLEEGRGIAVDDNGYVYVAGNTASMDFPTVNGYQDDQADAAIFVSKLDTGQGGAGLLYSTYLGGSGYEEVFGIAVDNSGNAYVTGETGSMDFPIMNQFQGYKYSRDAFVTKLDTNQAGTAGLVYSTYLGGGEYSDYGEDGGYAIAVDDNGNAYVTGYTCSHDFPIVNGFQPDHAGPEELRDAFVAHLDTTQSGSASLIYSTYLGGAHGYETGRSIAVDAGGNVYVTGETNSRDFPLLDGYQVSYRGLTAFVTRLDTSRTGAASLIYSTYLGGARGFDWGYGIAVDNSGCAYVTGKTESPDFPVMGAYRSYLVGASDAFVAKLDTTQSGAAGLLYSTYLGGDDDDEGLGIGLDADGNTYVTGKTFSTDFPTLNPIQVYQNGFWEGDAFVTKIDTGRSGSGSLVYSTYLGGDGDDTARGIAVDAGGGVYVAGQTSSTDFPTVNPFQLYSGGGWTWEAFVAKITPPIPPAIDVSAPNGGENWRQGSTQTITWNAADVPGYVKITLYKDGVFVGRIADNLDPAPGSYTWTVGEHSGGTAPPGDGYTVKVKEIGTAVSDTSDSAFSISRLAVTSPNGLEVWMRGSSRLITWGAVDGLGILKITLYKDGVQVGIIADNVDPASGFYTWTVGEHSGGTAIPGVVYTVKIKEKGTTVSDVSDVSFTIGGILVEAPNGGENLQIGSYIFIRWYVPGITGKLKVTLYKDGVFVGRIFDDVQPSYDHFKWSWKVGQHSGGTAAPGTGYTIKVKEKDTTVSDVSDAPFTLID